MKTIKSNSIALLLLILIGSCHSKEKNPFIGSWKGIMPKGAFSTNSQESNFILTLNEKGLGTFEISYSIRDWKANCAETINWAITGTENNTLLNITCNADKKCYFTTQNFSNEEMKKQAEQILMSKFMDHKFDNPGIKIINPGEIALGALILYKI